MLRGHETSEEKISRSQNVLGLVDQNKYFGFYFKYNGKSLKAFRQKDDTIQITFQKDHWLL